MSEQERLGEAQDLSEGLNEDGEMMWEAYSRRAIERAAASIEKDEIRGVVYMDDGEDHRFRPNRSEFESWEEVMHALTEIGENEWVKLCPVRWRGTSIRPKRGRIRRKRDERSRCGGLLRQHFTT